MLYGVILASIASVRAQSLAPALTVALYFPASPKVVNTEHFQLIGEGDANWSSAMGTRLESLFQTFYLDMEHAGFRLEPPRAPLTWICFDSQSSLGAYASDVDQFDAHWLREYYSPKTNRVAMLQTRSASASEATRVAGEGSEPNMPWVAHEEAHQLSFSSGLFKPGIMYPVWISEGIATSFESGKLAGMYSGAQESSRAPWLVEAYQHGRLQALDQFVVASRFRPEEGYDLRVAYAQAQGLFQYFLTQRPQALRSYLAGLAALDPGPRSSGEMLAEFERAFGSIKAVDPAWHTYLANLAEGGKTVEPRGNGQAPPRGSLASH